MTRFRLAGAGIALVVLVTVLGAGPGRSGAEVGGPPLERAPLEAEAIDPVAVVGWPPSSGLLLAEVVTGGASASDEYVEITNAASVPIDLGGHELVYVTSSGGTVTRKVAWAGPLFLGPGQHLLVANSQGRYASIADALYSGGLAASGGSLVLRPIGGGPVDAVGWGDATNTFVEGAPAPAPAPDGAIERRPGGPAGNGEDTNDNAADWFLQPAPIPQNLASSPAPEPSPEPAPSSTPGPSPSPSPTASPSPTPSPTPAPSLSPSPTATATSTPSPTPTATPTPSPTPTATPAPTPTSTPTTAIAALRASPLGTVATVAGVLTTNLGALEAGRAAFLQDETAGIGLYLSASVVDPLPAGTRLLVRGSLDSRYGQLVLRVAEADLERLGEEELPDPLSVATGAAGEATEGLRVTIQGRITESPSALTDGLGVTVDDGSGPLRVVVGPAALGDHQLARGDVIVATGPLGQRDSSGTGLSGYRVHATLPGELVVAPNASPDPSTDPTPTPVPSPTASPEVSPSPTPEPPPMPTPTTTPSPSPGPSAEPSPSATPSPTPAPIPIEDARSMPVGSVVRILGTVTAEPGRLGQPPLVVLADATAAIVLRLEDDDPPPNRGDLLLVEGTLADPYGQLEIRATRELVRLGPGVLPEPLPVRAVDLGEATEARLVRLSGVVDGAVRRATSGDIAFDVVDDDGATVRIMADASSGITAGSFQTGARYELTGILGQRASRKGRLDGYRIWLRDLDDVLQLASATPTPTSTPLVSRPTPETTPPLPVVPLRTALRVTGQVTIEATVTAPATLLDASGRRIVVEDATAAVEVLLPLGAAAPSVGEAVRVTGSMGRAYGAPRLRATAVERLGVGRPIVPARLDRAPGPADEWRLVRVSGSVADLRRLGGRWRAELLVAGERVVVDGLAGANIPASLLVEGRSATVTGIVRRPYPTATDRRFGVVPRGPSDIAVGPPTKGTAPLAGRSTPAAGWAPRAATSVAVQDVDLADLESQLGARVRVGGIVVDLTADGFLLDDGTATGRIVLLGEAADYAPLVEPGDAVNVIGLVRALADGSLGVVVETAAGLLRAGDLGGPSELESAGADSGSLLEASPTASLDPQIAGLEGIGGPGFGLPAGLVLLGTVASLLVPVVRRNRARLQLASRVNARLQTLARERRP